MVLLIIAVVIIAVLAILYFVGNKLQKKQEAQRAQLESAAQMYSMLVIDKKKMKMTAGFPKMVIDQIPKRGKIAKVPVVKVKIGPKITPLLCDELIYDQVPVKTEIKAKVSGIYITEIHNLRNVAPPQEPKGFFKKFKKKTIEASRNVSGRK